MPQIELLHTDCIEYMAGLPDKAFDLAIVDPPYGIGISDFKRKNTKTAKFDGTKAWDDNRPSPEYFKELFRVSCDQVVWGMNHLHDMLPTTRGFVSWFKHQNGHFSECELAWTSGNRGRYFDLPYQADLYGKIHPTQKPVALYRWLLKNYAKPGQRILDTHLGSGSIAIACDMEGFDLVGCEIDADYIKAARHRLAVHQSAPRLFEATPAGLPQQLSLGDDVLSDGT